MKKHFKIFSLIIVALLTFSNCSKKAMGPMACCTVPATGTVGTAVSFSSACSMDATDFKWMFGDGDSSMDATPTHVYTAAATYTVKLMVMRGTEMNQTSKSITIN